MLNVRYPGPETRAFFLPSIDTLVLLGAFALLARSGRRPPAWTLGALSLAFVFVRLLRLSDGISDHLFHRNFELYVKLSLLTELPRTLRGMLPDAALGALGGGLLLALALLAMLSYAALCVIAAGLAEARQRRLYVAVCLATAAIAVLPSRGPLRPLVACLPASVAKRVVSELVTVPSSHRAAKRVNAEVQAIRAQAARMPTNLAKLGRADVILFVIESYGETLLEDPAYVGRMRAELAAFDAELGARGYQMASSILDSPTFGGLSWLAHAALTTGVRTEDQLDYHALEQAHPLTSAALFRAAGYHTVLARPRSEQLAADFLDFDENFYASSFDYRGPEFGWGKLPDQYVIDFVHRRVLAHPRGPCFLMCVLVSSHAPWPAEPAVIDDWSRIGDGSVLASMPSQRHRGDWSSVGEASAAYADAVVYDLEVLRRYLATELSRDALVIIVGDHQPPGGVTLSSQGHGVPVHVLSRRPALLAPFHDRGYSDSMWPRENSPHRKMEDFLLAFVRDFSENLRQTSVVGGPTP